MMFTPCCPSAGPIGGLGLASPALTCNFIFTSTCFFEPPLAGAAFAFTGPAILLPLKGSTLHNYYELPQLN